MWKEFSLFPERASEVAYNVDALYTFLVVVSAVMTLVIFLTVFFFAIKYRRSFDTERPLYIHGSVKLEVLLVGNSIPGDAGYVRVGHAAVFQDVHAAADAMEIYVIGKQWMWKVQYPDGAARDQRTACAVGSR